jgi:hypothetical protein
MSDETESTNQLLRVIIALLLDQSEKHPKLRQKVDFLDRSGMKPSEIAKVLGKTGTYVSKELTGIRKERKRG